MCNRRSRCPAGRCTPVSRGSIHRLSGGCLRPTPDSADRFHSPPARPSHPALLLHLGLVLHAARPISPPSPERNCTPHPFHGPRVHSPPEDTRPPAHLLPAASMARAVADSSSLRHIPAQSGSGRFQLCSRPLRAPRESA